MAEQGIAKIEGARPLPEARMAGTHSTVLSVDDFQVLSALATTVAPTEFVPKDLRNSAPKVLACFLSGKELDLPPMTSLREISIVDGKPSFSAALVTSMVRAAGHRIWREEHRDADGKIIAVTAHGKRSDGEEDSFRFGGPEAIQAGLASKQNFRQYPAAMYWARAATQLARFLFSDVFMGSVYTPEELGGEVSADDIVAEAEAPAAVPELAEEAEVVEPPAEETGEGADATSEDAEGAAEPPPAVEETPSPEDLFGKQVDSTSVPDLLKKAPDATIEWCREVLAHEQGHKKRKGIVEALTAFIAEKAEQAYPVGEAASEDEPLPFVAASDWPGELPDPANATGIEKARTAIRLISSMPAETWPGEKPAGWQEAALLSQAARTFSHVVRGFDDLSVDECNAMWGAVPAAARKLVPEGWRL